MRGQRIVSKISKFGNFTIRKSIFDEDKAETCSNVIDKQAKDVNSRPPLGQISLNVVAAAATTSKSSNAQSAEATSSPTKSIADVVEVPTTTKSNTTKTDDKEGQEQQHKQQLQQQKKLTNVAATGGGQSDNGDKTSSMALVKLPACTSEAFVIYADNGEEEEEDDETAAADGKEWEEDADHQQGGTSTAGGTHENVALSKQQQLSPGKENIPPYEKKHEILLNFSSGTDDDTLNSSSISGTTADRNKLTTNITTTTKSSSGKLSSGIATATTTNEASGTTDGEEGSELGSDHYQCPSEYMTALTHHSLKSADENVTKMGRQQLTNPMYCAYDADIFRWHLHREHAVRARNYMPLQSDITETMRAVLIDWCVDVVTEFELCPATFFLAVSITDRTLSRVDCPRDKLQLLGAAALLTASKMHEIFPPTIKDIVLATDDCYTEAQVLRMEKIILKATNFSLGFPLVDTFAEFFDYFAPAPLGDVQRHMMWYLLELSTLNFSAVYRHLPSRLAAAAFLIALHFPPSTGGGTAQPKGSPAEQKQEEHKNDEQAHATSEEPLLKWETMEQQTQIMRKELAEPVKTLLNIHRQANASTDGKLKAVHKKFSDARHDRVARMELPSALASQSCDDA